MQARSQLKQTKDARIDRVFHALADRTRRVMLARLSERPHTVSELAEPFAMSRPAASKHLRVLQQAGLVARKIDGRIHHCALNGAPLREVHEWLDAYRSFWTGALDALADYVERGKPKRGRTK